MVSPTHALPTHSPSRVWCLAYSIHRLKCLMIVFDQWFLVQIWVFFTMFLTKVIEHWNEDNAYSSDALTMLNIVS